ncbi:hypothetical protein SteCoe_11628 [Stentor coeruleus]|uniref:Uncharacterized protein n=1 Tax=Stentor coeruleus TaxID=5963 RepID=A0A1R2CCM3_9CILI|nr:hypothetical protein SteCoe_11628 [Stentor coeruleus]
MKQTENNIESLNVLRKFSKTPSTICSLSTSPWPGHLTQEEILLNNLKDMQSMLTAHLRRLADFLSMQVPLLHYRWNLTNIRHMKDQKLRYIIGNILKRISENLDIKKASELARLGENQIEDIKEQTFEIKKQLKSLRKKYKIVGVFEKKYTLLTEKCYSYNNCLENLKENKSNLLESLMELKKSQNRICFLYIPIKERLEEIMIRKEELILSIPQIGMHSQVLEVKKAEVNQIETSNTELKSIVQSLTQQLEAQKLKSRKKASALKEQIQKFECQLALMRVQERFLLEKQNKINNLADIL